MAEQGVPATASTVIRNLTPEDALEVGRRIGKSFPCVGVVIDADPLSPVICNAFIAGVNSVGADVLYAGVCTTPAAILYFSGKCGCTAAIGSTISVGMPRIALYNKDGSCFDELDMRVLEEVPADLPDWSGIGSVKYCEDVPEFYSRKVAAQKIRISGGVVLDCGCGATVSTAPVTLSDLGADIITFNADDRAQKPRNPSAAIEDKGTFVKLVGLSIGTIGASMNEDGTKMEVLDEDGTRINRNEVLAMLLKYMAPRVAVIPFESPATVEQAFESPLDTRADGHAFEQGRRLIRTLNDKDTFQICRNEEEVDIAALRDGSIIFPKLSLCPDAVYATAILAELAGIMSLRSLRSEFKEQPSRTAVIPYTGNPRTLEPKLRDAVEAYHAGTIVSDSRGYAWKVFMKNGVYSIIPSNREIITIIAESPDEMYLVTMMEQAKEIVGSCLN